jgi:hypothetical protein
LDALVVNWPVVAVAIPAIVVGWLTLAAMRESSERQLRAYVVAESGNIVNVANPDPMPAGSVYKPTGAEHAYPWGPIAYIRIKNAGQTPAFDVRHWGEICFREFPLTSEFPWNKKGVPAASMLGPGIFSTKTLFFGPELTLQEIASLKDGTGGIYVHGEITYRDAFGKKHITNYRLVHHKLGGAIGISTDLSFADGGNNAD